MNIRKLALPLSLVAFITACDGLKEALTAHTDVAARVEQNELSVTRLGDLLGNTTLQIAATRDVATILTDLWTSYQLMGVAAARRDSLTDGKLIDEATLGISATSRLRRFMERKSQEFKADSGTEATYVQAPYDLFHARHILFAILGGATQPQKDSVKRVAEGVRARTTSANFAEMARACGDEGIRVTDPRQVEEALRQGLAATRRSPALVEVMVKDHPYPKLSLA